MLDKSVNSDFPHPIAVAWRKVKVQTSDTGRIKASVDCQEVIMRTLLALVLPDYLRGQHSQRVEELLEKLSRPSQGHYVALIREVLRCLSERVLDPFMPEAVEWYFNHKGKPTKAAKALDDLVALRNLEMHGGSSSGSSQERARAEEFVAKLRAVLDSLRWTVNYRLFRVVNQRNTRSGGVSGSVQFLTGQEAVTEPINLSWGATLLKDTVYLAASDGTSFLEIEPFMSILEHSGVNAERLFLFQSTIGGMGLVLVHDESRQKQETLPDSDKGSLPFDAWLARRKEIPFLVANKYPDDFQFKKALSDEESEGLIDDRFELRETLGEGGMAVVYLVWDRFFQKEYALKIMLPELSGNSVFAERFVREARTMMKFGHVDSIVGVDDTDKLKDGRLYLRLPYLSGGTLKDRLETGKLSIEEARPHMERMLEGLVAIHALSVVHRDVKPSNYLLDESGKIYLSDFGIALTESETRLTRTMEQLGSLAYMSPEQRKGKDVDGRTDVYSLGVVFHEMLTGKEGQTVPGEGIREPLGSLIAKMTVPDANERLSAASALAILRGEDAPAEGLVSVDTAETPSGQVVPETLSANLVKNADGFSDDEAPERSSGGFANRVWFSLGAVLCVCLVAFWYNSANDPEPSSSDDVTSTGEPITLSPNGAVPNDFVRLEPGNFMMGTTFGETGREDDETEHRVRLSRAFFLAKHEVTQGKFEALLGYNPSKFNRRILGTDTSQHPVESIRWLDAINYANAFSRQKGLPECYAANGSVKDGSIYECKGYRLPTEAEWEYAARQGQTRVGNASLYGIAWYRGNSNQQTQPVGTRAANAIGVHDMLGNVWEFCHDWYDDYNLGVAVTADPAGPPSSPKNMRVARGGAWNSLANSNRTGNRHHVFPQDRGRNFGFRLALTAH